jgi:hypothetical protein
MSVTNILNRLFQDGTGNKLRQEILPPIPSDLLPSIPINLLPQKELDARAAHAAAISFKSIQVSVSGSDITYVPPEDGYVGITGIPISSAWIGLNFGEPSIYMTAYANAGGTASVLVPVAKGKAVIANFDPNVTFSRKAFVFIYANGNAPE